MHKYPFMGNEHCSSSVIQTEHCPYYNTDDAKHFASKPVVAYADALSRTENTHELPFQGLLIAQACFTCSILVHFYNASLDGTCFNTLKLLSL